MRLNLLRLLACLLLLSMMPAVGAQSITVRSASLLASTQTTLTTPQDSTVSLPHRWDKAFPGQAGTATYVLDMPALDASSQEVALYIPRLGNQAQLFVRRFGQREPLQQFGNLGDPYYDASKSPQWIALPTSIKLAGAPWQLEIQITAQTGRYAGLSAVSYGHAAALRPEFNTNHLWRQTSSQIIVLALGLLGLLAAGLWWKLREPSFGLFAITALLGLIRMADRLLPQTLLPWPWWGALMAIAYAWHLLFMVAFCLHVAGSWQRAQRIGLWGWLIGSAILALLAFGLYRPGLWTIALLSMAVPGIYAFYSLVQRWRLDRHREALLLALCGLLLMSVGVRDFLAVRLANSEELTFSFMPIALFTFVLTMAWIIIERYSRQVLAYRELNTSLESRVAQRDRQLQESYSLLKTTGEEKAALAERARIMRDIHDGVGAQLVGLVSLLQGDTKRPEELREHAQQALDELRMAVDSLQPVEGSLSTVLATLRYRLQPRLKAAGIDVQWEVDELPKLDSLTPTAVLQVQRILLEAFTNVIRHSGAGIVQVRALHVMHDDGGQLLSLCVDDNGSSAQLSVQPQANKSTGQGQANMRWRAQSIGAQLHIEKSPLGGLRVRLEWLLKGS
jgi:signal transduction histidine kinase